MKTIVRFYLAIAMFTLMTVSVFGNQTSTLEFGIRRWPSTGSVNFGFQNGSTNFGNPTSTLDWRKLHGLNLELFSRWDHRSGLYLKGIAGLGDISSGIIINRDFYVGQVKFSDTSSQVSDGRVIYANLDLGYGRHFTGGSRIGGFIGGQILSSKLVATGLKNEFDQNDRKDLERSGIVNIHPASFYVSSTYDGIQVSTFEPRWYFLRIGVDGKIVFHRWSLEGEAVSVSSSKMVNYDNHLLRRIRLISRSVGGRGFQVESFINYAWTSKNEVGVGFRFYRIITNTGSLNVNDHLWTTASPNGHFAGWLTKFSETRFGMFLQFRFFL